METKEFDRLPTAESINSALLILKSKKDKDFRLVTIIAHPCGKELHYTAYFEMILQ